jgi:hypothetical protein
LLKPTPIADHQSENFGGGLKNTLPLIARSTTCIYQKIDIPIEVAMLAKANYYLIDLNYNESRSLWELLGTILSV